MALEEGEKRVIELPKGFEKWEPSDFKLLEGETVRRIVQPKLGSFLRVYAIGIALMMLAYTILIAPAMYPLPLRKP